MKCKDSAAAASALTCLGHVYTVHCNEIWIYVFLEKELRGPSHSFHIHLSVSDLNIPTFGPPIGLMEADLQSLFWAPVTWCAQLYSLAETPQPPPPLVYESAIGQQRQTTSLCNPLGPPIFLQQNIRPMRGIHINRSQKHECRNGDCSRAVPFLGIFVSNFRYCVFAV